MAQCGFPSGPMGQTSEGLVSGRVGGAVGGDSTGLGASWACWVESLAWGGAWGGALGGARGGALGGTADVPSFGLLRAARQPASSSIGHSSPSARITQIDVLRAVADRDPVRII